MSGHFFGTVDSADLISDAFQQVAQESGVHTQLPAEMFQRQELFSKVRHVDQASVSIRFRIMTEAEACANLLNSAHFPEIGDGTLSMVIYLGSGRVPDGASAVFDWRDAARFFGDLPAYQELDAAFAATEPRLRSVTSALILSHPLNGPFFVARMPLNW